MMTHPASAIKREVYKLLLTKTQGGFRWVIPAGLYFNSMRKGGTHDVVHRLDPVFGCSMFPRYG